MFEHFDWSIKFGDILTLAGAAYVGSSILYKRGGNDVRSAIILKNLADEVKELKDEFKTFSETLKTVAVQESKINLLMQWYDELRRGVGFIRD